MAKPTLDQVRNIGDIMDLVNWNMRFASLPSGLNSNIDFNHRCVSATLPKDNGTPMEVFIRNHKIKQPGQYTPEGTITLTFVEGVDAAVLEFIRQWRELCCQKKTGIQRPKKEVEAVVILDLLDRAGNEVFTYKLIGCFLENYELGGDLADQGSEARKPTITLSYDDYEDSKVG